MSSSLDNLDFGAFGDASGSRRLGFVEGMSSIWIPPRTELEVIGDGRWKVVTFPVPERLSGGVENRFESDDLPSGLQEAGWKKRRLSDTDSLVEDFVALSETSDDDGDVKYFAKKYGPMWICPRHGHFWSPIHPENVAFNNPDPQAYCLWVPSEAVRQFRGQARQLKACLEIAKCLRDGSKAPRTHFENLFGHHLGNLVSDLVPSKQKERVAVALSGFILQWVTPWVTWDQGLQPRLMFQTGLGFMGLAWLQAAQLIAGGVDARTCSGCHRFYFRRERKPPKGWNNFCDECRETDGKKGAKRLWAEKARKKQREAKAKASRRKTTKGKE